MARVGNMWGVTVLLSWGVALMTSQAMTTPLLSQNQTAPPMSPLNFIEIGESFDTDDEEIVLAAVEPGNVVLGGLFMIHQAGEGNDCGALAGEMGVQALETMLYTVDVINNSTFLPGFRLGVLALDDCNQESKSLEQTLEFVHPPECENDSERAGPQQHEAVNLVGVVGSASSLNSITVANLLKLFKIPQISYWSTSPDLSNTLRFPYFFRAVPSDQYQAQAMIDILLYFNWTYISLVYENSNYGVQGIEEVKRHAGDHDVCVAVNEMIPRDGNESAYDRIVANLLKATDAKAVILWAMSEIAAKFFKAAKRANVLHKFVWIGSDSWSGRQLTTVGNEQVIEGAITMQPMSEPIPAFDDYFTNLNPLTYDRNPWFREFWEQHFNCYLPSGEALRDLSHRPQCVSDLKLGSENNYSQEGQIQFVADSVWAFAHALRDMHKGYCNGKPGLCSKMRPVKGHELREFLRNVSFEGVSHRTFRFTAKGDGPVHYKILNFQQVSANKYRFVNVGHYKDGLHLNLSAMRYSLQNAEFPKSSCWRECLHNEMKFKRDGECCWSCLLCQQYEYLRDKFTCTECPNGTKPSPNLTVCTDIDVRYMRPNTTITISALVFATVGEFATFLTAVVYVRNRDTPVVKASGRELSGLLLGGVFMCYALTYLFLLSPSIVTCGLQQFLMGIAFTMCYASLLVKTNRVYRIFTYGKSTTKRPNFISPLSQIVITLLMVTVQGFLSITWLAAVPPNAVKHYPTRGDVQIVCNAFLTSTSLLGLAFPLVLLIICTGFAFLTRKIPGHFNEAKYIGFTMYSSCIVWLAMVPVYVLTVSNIQLRIVSLYIAISLCATVCLVCLFVPRIYLIVMRPERNVRITINSGPGKLRLTGSVFPNTSSNISNHSPYSHEGRTNTL